MIDDRGSTRTDEIRGRAPDFICVGAQKAATSWLYTMMRTRPDIYLPAIKEVHYFSEVHEPALTKYGPAHRIEQADAVRKHWENRDDNPVKREEMIARLKDITAPVVDDDWYRGLFQSARPDQLCGDIGPEYLSTGEAGVVHMLELNPQVRTILLLRDPVDRAWSQIRMEFRDQPHIRGVAENKERREIFLRYTNYAGWISAWDRHADPDRRLIMLFDDIKSDPNASLKTIFSFLGLSSGEGLPDASRVVYGGTEREFPERLHRKLLDLLMPQYDFLAEFFPEQVERWLNRHLAECGEPVRVGVRYNLPSDPQPMPRTSTDQLNKVIDMPTNPTWRYNNDHDLLVACVGYNFGPKPLERLEDIRVARGGYGKTVAHRMGLKKDDVVLDIGSGCGFVGRTIAPLVGHLHCADLSADFLDFCERELSEFPNVSCHQMKYADYSVLEGLGINKVYSTAVWIHFNFYDFFHNLTGLHKLLPVGGEIYFDYADPEGIKDGDGRIFKQHSTGYLQNREAIFNLVQFNGISAVRTVLEMTGFELVERFQTAAQCFSIRARKV